MSTVYIHLVVALIESRTLNKTSSRQYLIYIDASIEGRSCESYTLISGGDSSTTYETLSVNFFSKFTRASIRQSDIIAIQLRSKKKSHPSVQIKLCWLIFAHLQTS